MARGVARPNSVVGRYTPGHYWSNQWPFREAQGLGPFYDPAALFRNGEQGGVYDPSDLDSMFQGYIDTSPAAIGQTVGLRLDKKYNLARSEELNPLGNLSGWTNTNATITANSITCTTVPGGATQTLMTVGKVYEVSVMGSSTVESDITINTADAEVPTVRTQLKVGLSGVPFVFYADRPVLYIRFGVLGSCTITKISVREIPGNHLIQATAASRATLSARYNKATNTGFTLGVAGAVPTDWIERGLVTGRKTVDITTRSGQCMRVTSGGGALGATDDVRLTTISGLTVGFTYTIKFKVKAGPGNTAINLGCAFGATTANAPLTAMYSDFEFSHVATGASHSLFFGGVNGVVADVSDIEALLSSDVDNIPYQEVRTATDYDTIGFPTYLLYDGVDDGYASIGNVDFSGTDKMTVWAGVTKLSDAARGMFLIHDNAGTQRVDIEIPSAGLGDYLTQCGGTLLTTASVAAAAPETSVLTVNENIAGDSLILRRDGVQVSASAADQGAGNFSNTPLYVGKTGAGTLPFNGREYGLIIRGAESTATEIVQFEDYMAQKAGIAPL